MKGYEQNPPLPGLPNGILPYDWALQQLHITKSNEITRGSKDIIVALIDLGYRHHPDLDGHLWVNPKPVKGDIHGWDFVDDDASLEYSGTFDNNPNTRNYYLGHHVFVAGEIAAAAPVCPIMILRIGYTHPFSHAPAVRYAVDNGARILVIPHGYMTFASHVRELLFNQGVDFTYPEESAEYRKALDYAYDNGCLIFSGSSDNRGRRVAVAGPGYDMICAVGSSNNLEDSSNICSPADYVEFGAPGGERLTDNPVDHIWGCGGELNYIPFEGGCMACGFAGGVAALLFSRFPNLTNDEVRCILRNTAKPVNGMICDEYGWEPNLGYGILDAEAAVSINPINLRRDVRVIDSSIKLIEINGKFCVNARLRNDGVFDSEHSIAVVYNGNPTKPVDTNGTAEKPAQILQTKQIGHTITRVRGLHEREITIELTDKPSIEIWIETYCLDRHDQGIVHRCCYKLNESKH